MIVTRDRPDDLAKCLDSLEKAATGTIREVVVVDDASRVPPRLEKSDLKIRLLRNEKRSFLSTSRNRGARGSTGKYIMFIDDDNVVDRTSLEKLSSRLGDDAQGMVASPAIFYTSQPDRIWFAGGRIGRRSGMFLAAFRGGDSGSLPIAPYYTGVFHDAFMVKREAFERAGYFDEESFPMYLSEADLAARLSELGFRAFVVPASRVWHNIAPLEGMSSILRGVHITEPVRAYFVGRNRLLYMRRHGSPSSFLVHVAFFEPAIITIHLFAIFLGHSRVPRARLFGPYLRGLFDGLAGRVKLGANLVENVS